MSTDFGRKYMLTNLKNFDSSRLYSVGLTSGDSDRAKNRHVSANGTRIAHPDPDAHRLSTIRTLTPERARALAHMTPAGPAPKMRTST